MELPVCRQPLETMRNSRYDGGRPTPSRASTRLSCSSVAPGKPSQPDSATSAGTPGYAPASMSSLLQVSRNGRQSTIVTDRPRSALLRHSDRGGEQPWSGCPRTPTCRSSTRDPRAAVRRAPGAASPQRQQLLGALLEHAEDRLSVGDVERDDPGFAVVGAFEPFGGVDELGFTKAGGELEDGLVGDRDPCEPHDDDRTQRP